VIDVSMFMSFGVEKWLQKGVRGKMY